MKEMSSFGKKDFKKDFKVKNIFVVNNFKWTQKKREQIMNSCQSG